jgi:hypothetical protein
MRLCIRLLLNDVHHTRLLRSGRAQRMCLRVAVIKLAYTHPIRIKSLDDYSQYILIQIYEIRLAKDEIEVLQCLRHPEALTLIEFLRLLPSRDRDVCDGRVCVLSYGGVVNGFKHAPCGVL